MAKNLMSRFEVFIGIWNTVGEVFATSHAPATTLVATDIYRWLPGRQFIIHDVDARFGSQVTRSMEVLGYDRDSKRYLSRSYDDQGESGVYEVSLKGRRWKIVGDVVRFDGRFSQSTDVLEGLWEIKDGATWCPWIDLKLTRAS